jgi:hypothetical protein
VAVGIGSAIVRATPDERRALIAAINDAIGAHATSARR